MVSFKTSYVSHQDAVTQLTHQLRAHGATETRGSEQPDLWIIGANTVAEAAHLLEQVPECDRDKALIVGLPGTLDVRELPRSGTLAGLVERHRPLGILAVSEAWNPDLAGFIGPKGLAEMMGAGFLKQHASSHYASWLRCDGTDAGDFVLKLVRARRAVA
jgi:hypothetical protein